MNKKDVLTVGNKAKAISRVKQLNIAKRYADEPKYHDDKEVTLLALEYNPTNLRFVSERLRSDKDVGLTAVSLSGANLVYLSESLRRDKEVVMRAVSNMGFSLLHASEELLNDKEVVLTALNTGINLLEHLPYSIRSDKEVVLKAIRKNPMEIEYAGEELKSDVEVATVAYSLNRNTLKFIGESAFYDKRFAQTALKISQNTIGNNVLSNDLPEHIFKAISASGYKINLAMQNLNLSLIDRKKLLYVLSCSDGDFGRKSELFHKYVEEDDSQVINVLISKKILSPTKVKPEMLYAMKNKKIKVLPILLSYTKDVKSQTQAVRLSNRDKLLKSLKRGAKTAVKRFKEEYELYLCDREVVLEAVRVDGSVFFLVCKKYACDKEIAYTALTNYIVNNADVPFLSVVSSGIKDVELCRLACKKDERNLLYVPQNMF